MSFSLRDFGLASKKGMATAALALAVFGASMSTAFAGEQCLPGKFEPTRGVKGGDCYVTSEMNKALQAYGQRTLVYGNRIGVTGTSDGVAPVLFLNAFTSNAQGTLGFNIEGDAPAGQSSTRFSVGAVMSDVRLWDRAKPYKPSEEVVGRLNAQGIEKSGDRLMLTAKYGDGVYLAVVTHPSMNKVGDFMSANDQEGAALATMRDLDYTNAGKQIIAQQGQQVSMLEPK